MDHSSLRSSVQPNRAGGVGDRLILDGEGFAVGLIGRVFAAIYARNLDRAILNLVKELEQLNTCWVSG